KPRRAVVGRPQAPRGGCGRATNLPLKDDLALRTLNLKHVLEGKGPERFVPEGVNVESVRRRPDRIAPSYPLHIKPHSLGGRRVIHVHDGTLEGGHGHELGIAPPRLPVLAPRCYLLRAGGGKMGPSREQGAAPSFLRRDEPSLERLRQPHRFRDPSVPGFHDVLFRPVINDLTRQIAQHRKPPSGGPSPPPSSPLPPPCPAPFSKAPGRIGGLAGC